MSKRNNELFRLGIEAIKAKTGASVAGISRKTGVEQSDLYNMSRGQKRVTQKAVDAIRLAYPDFLGSASAFEIENEAEFPDEREVEADALVRKIESIVEFLARAVESEREAVRAERAARQAESEARKAESEAKSQLINALLKKDI